MSLSRDPTNGRKRWQRVIQTFKQRHGHVPSHIVRAPGRVNVLGEHIDYSLFVSSFYLYADRSPSFQPLLSKTSSLRYPRPNLIPVDLLFTLATLALNTPRENSTWCPRQDNGWLTRILEMTGYHTPRPVSQRLSAGRRSSHCRCDG